MRVVATAGHVDHGKSTLVRALTGMEPDRWDEERRRGLTLDLGFVWTDLGVAGQRRTVAFVDVPGHHRYVTNMLAGAGAIEDALLVVAADDGWSAQSREHLAILDLLAVRGLAVAITKADVVDAARLADVHDEVTRTLATTSWAATPIVAVDGVTGRGVDDLGQLLARRLAEIPPRPGDGDVRLWVDRSFSIAGAGTVVTGTLAGAALTGGDEVTHAPSGRRLRVRGLQALGVTVEGVEPGARVAVNLAGVARDQLRRGDALITGAWAVTDTVDVEVRSITDRDLTARGAWTVHVGAAARPAELYPLEGRVAPHGRGLVRLELAGPLPLRYGDRLVIREAGVADTLAGARVLDQLPGRRPRGRRARRAAVDHLGALAVTRDRGELVRAIVGRHAPTTAQALHRRLGPVPDDVAGITAIGGALVTDAVATRWRETVVTTVVAAADEGALLGDVDAALRAADAPAGVHRAVVADLEASGRVAVRAGRAVATDRAGPHDRARRQRRDAVVAALTATPWQPPDVADVARDLRVPPDELRALYADGTLVRLGELTLAAAAVSAGVERLRAVHGTAPFTAAQARDAWGTSRRVAIPLLEHLAAIGATTFDGRHHRLNAHVVPGHGRDRGTP